jgi:hypothetical protein
MRWLMSSQWKRIQLAAVRQATPAPASVGIVYDGHRQRVEHRQLVADASGRGYLPT